MIIEDITEEADSVSLKNNDTSLGGSLLQRHESRVQDETDAGISTTNAEYLHALKDDPDAIRYLEYFGFIG